MRVTARDARVQVPAQGFHDRDAGGDVTNVDLEDLRHGIWYPDPGQIVRLDLPRRRHPRYRDPARYNAQAHQAAQADLALSLDVEVPQEDDGEGGADEIGDEGEDALRDEYVHDHLQGEAMAGFAQVPDFADGVALEDV